jgi:hypothetical protein
MYILCMKFLFSDPACNLSKLIVEFLLMNCWNVIFSFIRHDRVLCNVSQKVKNNIFSRPNYIYSYVNLYICNTLISNPLKNLSKLFVKIYVINYWKLIRSQDSAVSIATGYGLDEQGIGIRVPVGPRIFSTPRRPDRLWGPPSLLSNRYWGLLPRG